MTDPTPRMSVYFTGSATIHAPTMSSINVIHNNLFAGTMDESYYNSRNITKFYEIVR